MQSEEFSRRARARRQQFDTDLAAQQNAAKLEFARRAADELVQAAAQAEDYRKRREVQPLLAQQMRADARAFAPNLSRNLPAYLVDRKIRWTELQYKNWLGIERDDPKRIPHEMHGDFWVVRDHRSARLGHFIRTVSELEYTSYSFDDQGSHGRVEYDTYEAIAIFMNQAGDLYTYASLNKVPKGTPRTELSRMVNPYLSIAYASVRAEGYSVRPSTDEDLIPLDNIPADDQGPTRIIGHWRNTLLGMIP